MDKLESNLSNDQILADGKTKSAIHIVVQLQEARLGDKDRLKSIKESLNSGKELTESDKKYLQERAAELKDAIDYQRKAEWTIDFIQKMQQEREGQPLTVEQIKRSLDSEKSRYKIDRKFLEKTSEQLKKAVERQKNVTHATELIVQLREAKIGDPAKLDHIKNLLQKGEDVSEEDQHYLKDRARRLTQILDCKKKASWSIDAIKKMQDSEMEHSRRLYSIRKKAEEGNLISENELNYINSRYEKLQKIMEQQNKIDWTLDTIKQLQEHEIGESDKLNSIKRLLEQERPVDQVEINYLKEKYKLLQQSLDYKNKIQLSLDIIKKLHESEIGNFERLNFIRKTIEERKPVLEPEINYLKEKYEQLLILKKSRDTHTETNDAEFQETEANPISNELNLAILGLTEYERNHNQK